MGAQLPEEWEKADVLSTELVELAAQIEVDLDSLAKKWKRLEALIIDSYKAAPTTDVGLYYCPISPTRMISALKNHSRKSGLVLDQRSYIDETKIPTFSNYVKEGKKWLLKMGYQAPIKEKANV